MICPNCGAVEYGNLTCRTCRAYMRRTARCPIQLLDQLDAAATAAQLESIRVAAEPMREWRKTNQYGDRRTVFEESVDSLLAAIDTDPTTVAPVGPDAIRAFLARLGAA